MQNHDNVTLLEVDEALSRKPSMELDVPPWQPQNDTLEIVRSWRPTLPSVRCTEQG
jgi:hypothetical protein